jgi:hypothetical protein
MEPKEAKVDQEKRVKKVQLVPMDHRAQWVLLGQEEKEDAKDLQVLQV